MSTIVFHAQFTASKLSKTGITVTFRYDRITRSDGTVTTVTGLTPAAATKTYFYALAAADLQTYDYIGTFVTADGTVDQQEVPALWTRFSEAVTTDAAGAVNVLGLTPGNLDAAVSTRLAPATPGRTLAVSSAGVADANMVQFNGAAALDYDGTAQGGTSTTITLDPADTAGDGAYVDSAVTIRSGPGAGESRVITANVAATKVAAIHRAWITPPTSSSRYTIDPTRAALLTAAGLDAVKGWGTWSARQTLQAIAQFLLGPRSGVPAAGAAGTVSYRDNAFTSYGTVTVDTQGNITASGLTPPA